MANLGHFSNFIKFYNKIIDKKSKIVPFCWFKGRKRELKKLNFLTLFYKKIMIWHLNFEIFIFSQPSAQSFNHIFMTNTLKYVDILYFGLILITWKGLVLGFCSMFDGKNYTSKIVKISKLSFQSIACLPNID